MSKSEISEERPVLNVSGSAEIIAPPDEVIVRLGVQERDATAHKAQNRSNGVMQAFIHSLEGLGIAKQHIQTSRMMLTDIQAHQAPGQKLKPPTYQASIRLSVRLSDFDLVGKVIDAGIASGVNAIEGVEFRLRNDRAHRLRAYKEAVQDARSKADSIAEALGMKIAGVDEVSAEGAYFPQPHPRMMGAVSGAISASSLEPGEIQVSVNISIRYWLD